MSHRVTVALPSRSRAYPALFAAALIVVLWLLLLQPTAARAGTVYSTGTLWKPDVSGSLIVWEDQDYNGDIWAGAGGAAFPVCQNGWSYANAPAVDGTVAVWQDDRLGSYKIYGATVDPAAGTATEFPVATGSGVKTDPDVSGRYVVWVDTRAGNQDIYGYDLLTQSEFVICNNTAKQEAPAVSGTLVVWRDFRNNSIQGDIYAARIGAGNGVTEFIVRGQTSGANYVEAQPAAHGSTVVWADQRTGTGNYRIYAATVTDTTVSNEWQVSQTVTRGVSNPAVNGTLIVWTYTGGTTNDDIYGRRLDQSPEFPIANTTLYESWPSVGASQTVYADRTNWDICSADYGGFGWSASVVIDGGAAYAMVRDVTLGLQASSSSGPATAMCFSSDGVDWGGWEAYATTRAWQLSAGDGTKAVFVQFRDGEGNVSPVKSDTIVLDENAPVTSDDIVGGWHSGPVEVTLTADDSGGSGVIGTVYDLDGVGNVTYSGPITVSGDGVHTLVYRSADAVGRAEEPVTAEIWIDGTAPVTTDDAGDGWHPSGFVLHLDGWDANGVDHTEYSIDGGAWQTGTSRVFNVSTKKAGGVKEFVVQYRSVDVAGNVEAAKACTVRIDARRPVTVDDYDGLPASTDLVVSLTPEDLQSGVLATWYSVDGSDPVEGTSVLVPAPGDGGNDGLHTIAYYSADQVGNLEMLRSVTVTIAAGGGAAPATVEPPAPDLPALPHLLKVK
jgi:beta propeller repeat protein